MTDDVQKRRYYNRNPGVETLERLMKNKEQISEVAFNWWLDYIERHMSKRSESQNIVGKFRELYQMTHGDLATSAVSADKIISSNVDLQTEDAVVENVRQRVELL
jgi:hypothetical protein